MFNLDRFAFYCFLCHAFFLSWFTWAFVSTGLLTLILVAGGLRSVKDVLLARVDDFLLEHALFLHRAVVDDGLGRRQVRLLDAI